MSKYILLMLISAVILLPILSFKMRNRRMLQFCYYMTVSKNVRRFFCYNILLAVIFFHFIYYNSHNTEWGLMVSTIPMLLMFSVKWQEWFIKRLNDNRKELWAFTILTLFAICVPHMFTVGITFALIVIAVAFYPSKIIRGIDPYFVSAEYSRAMMTGNYSRMIGCYFE